MKTCSESNCDRSVNAHGLCLQHRRRERGIVKRKDLQHRNDDLARFWSKVDQLVQPGCWIWTGSRLRQGYGQFSIGRTKTVKAHRWAYEHFVGPIPEGLTIDHLCRVRACVNPEHLEPVTAAENTRRGINYLGTKPNCKQGHPLSGDNLLLAKVPGRTKLKRTCRACKAIWWRQWRDRKQFLA